MRSWRWAIGAALVAYVASRTYTGDGWVFPFSYADLGFHELGHMLTMFWAPQALVSLAGSATQALVPVGLAAYFWFARSDLFAAALMVAWAGSSANNVSIYVYDATRRVLPLLGDQEGHDWAYLLGPDVLDALRHTDAIAYTVRTGSVLLFVGAFAMLGWGFWQPHRVARRERALAVYRATLPVRERPPAAPPLPAEGPTREEPPHSPSQEYD